MGTIKWPVLTRQALWRLIFIHGGLKNNPIESYTIGILTLKQEKEKEKKRGA